MNKELQFLLYNTPQENVKIDVVVKDEMISGQPHQKLMIFFMYSISKAALYCLFFKLCLSFIFERSCKAN
ncbi:hypothetical protein EZS27_010071, partial [termite gut metagenome]